MAKYTIVIELEDTIYRCLKCPLTNIVGGCKMQQLSSLTWHTVVVQTCPLKRVEEAEI